MLNFLGEGGSGGLLTRLTRREGAPEEQPFRADLLSIDRLQREARALAARHKLGPGRGNALLGRLGANARVLDAYNEETLRVELSRQVAPAAEWLLDNYYLIEEQIRTARRHLPRKYNRELPHLLNGPRAGLPRVYDLAVDLISHVDARLDFAHLTAFIAAYQEVSPLQLGELWAIPIILRLALIENLRRVAAQLGVARKDRDAAAHWANRLVAVAEGNPSAGIIAVAQMAQSEIRLTEAFVTEFWRRGQERSAAFKLAFHWLEEKLAFEGFSIDALVQHENQRQAADQVTVGNSISSLRFVDATDWREFVESLSAVEQVLRSDPAGAYVRMDFATRDSYRHVVEGLAKRGSAREWDVAQAAVELARRHAGKGDARGEHVGYYLVDEGLGELERETGATLHRPWSPRRMLKKCPLTLYLGGIGFIALFATAGGWGLLPPGTPPWAGAVALILCAVAASQLGVGLVNWLVTMFLPPRALPRYDFSEGIAPGHQTLVIVPTLLTSPAGVEHLLEGLEIRYLANRDPNVRFGLLTDLRDSNEELNSPDQALVDQARKGIEALNEKYLQDRPSIFFLFHRPRTWNERDRVWMGYERKRGKLGALNRLLLENRRQPFSVIVGDLAALSGVQFVITLDTDTQLPSGAARELAGTMAHPLNRAVYDPAAGRVTHGYGILQPRVGITLPAARRNAFTRLFSGDAGIDPYTRTVSDVYQDLFGEGSFIGKGIYDLRAFELAVGDKFPENRILSHDLLEGCYARSGLASDIQLFEGFPGDYPEECRRRHRWMRGDWQIASWLLARVPGANGALLRCPITGLSRWKIFDNLRRCLAPVAMVALPAFCWTMLPALAVWSTLLVAAIVFLPSLLSLYLEMAAKPAELSIRQHLRGVTAVAAGTLAQALLSLMFLPHDALVSLDATVRTFWRLRISRRNLLEWQTASGHDGPNVCTPKGCLRDMWFSPVLAVALAAALALTSSPALWSAAPLLALWLVAPLVAWRISVPWEPRKEDLTAREKLSVRLVARATWRYFETFISREHHWLPPDNFQEYPEPVVAARTSTTNIGMGLLSTLAAWDFGYLSLRELSTRVGATLDTLDRLPRFNGHFYNWYNTETLEPLLPLYISTVDNGNLAGCLFTLSEGLNEAADHPFPTAACAAGLRDTLGCWLAAARAAKSPGADGIAALLTAFDAQTAPSDGSLAETFKILSACMTQISALAKPDSAGEDCEFWREATERTCREHRDELLLAFPWLEMAAKDQLRELDDLLRWPATVGELDKALEWLRNRLSTNAGPAAPALTGLRDAILRARQVAIERGNGLRRLAERCDQFARMDFSFLFDPARKLFVIGYNVTHHQRDGSYYDLLASEARLASYIAIAQNQIPQDAWFALGRLVTSVNHQPTLISWSGSMFEYLTPPLLMPSYENTLLDVSCRAAVARQISYGRQRGVPWGISESCYNLTDAQSVYQYRAFGVPGLGFKRGLADDLVIAPYATLMSFIVDPREAWRNVGRLRTEGAEGHYGFYEAVDYTPSRVPRGRRNAVVRCYMAHHQGMAFLALTGFLLNHPMRRRFDANPLFRATELLLQERVPKESALLFPHRRESARTREDAGATEATFRVFSDPNLSPPEIHLLSNGRYHVMVTHTGGGYSSWQDTALTRWREDPTRDCWGMFLYLRDVDTGRFWSAAHQPTVPADAKSEAIFSQGRAEFRMRHHDIDSHVEIAVSAEDDVEVRRVTLTNYSGTARVIDLTTFAEVALNTPAADQAHPAFVKLFVQTQILPRSKAIICSRRPRARGEQPPWMFQLMLLQGGELGEASFETDRARFIGRTRNAASPAGMRVPGLSNSEGPVLDPSVSIRRGTRLEPQQSTRFTVVTGAAPSREAVMALVEKYQDQTIADRVFELAWTHGLVTLRHINTTEPEAQLFGRLAGSLLYSHPGRRANPAVLLQNRRGQRNLWSFGISGDLPIVLVRATQSSRIDFVRQILTAHAYWRLKGLQVDLVILNEDDSVYRQSIHDQIMSQIAASIDAHLVDKPGGIFVRRIEQVSQEDRLLLQSAARIVLSDEEGTLAEQLQRRPRAEFPPPALLPSRRRASRLARGPARARDLQFFNGLGGFAPDGREYVVVLPPGKTTPAPWVNVIANPHFGTLVSESGSAYTWFENCHEYRLTTWHNDPVSDTVSEAFYIRDEETGAFWSPSPLPARAEAAYTTRHGFGYSVFEVEEEEISSEMWTYVATDAPVKFVRVILRNQSDRKRTLSIFGFWEWVLGETRSRNLLHVVTEMDPRTGALLARNPYNVDFASYTAFAAATEPIHSFTASRTEFLGRNGSPARPAAMGRQRLSGRTGAGADPCAALQVELSLEPGEQREVVFKLGAARSRDEAAAHLHNFKSLDACRDAIFMVRAYWNDALGAVQVETPDAALNVLANGWLLYQTLSARMWGRTGFYQSGGAFGFRDQLQDAMALVHARPALLREHLLRVAGHQFVEGDVQHWWHPPGNRGVRTHFSDDYLWLPYATCRYVDALGDTGVLDEKINFLESRLLRPDEESDYSAPVTSPEAATLYQHCVRAIRHGLKVGEHGLPLMGCGDWNDGMNLVGEKGKGESVWLAFFLHDTLRRFSKLALQRNDQAVVELCETHARQLRESIEKNAWDGLWYRRAYFDDGTPLGSATSPECEIDSLPQSWAALSGAGSPERAREAMNAVDRRLVRREAGLIQLFDPPFDKSTLEPGYIKGYLPGVRENGGQYTHSAVWVVMAFAAMGKPREAWELFHLINPVRHSGTPEDAMRYKVEPYVIAADIYSVPPHTGRGGWTWYTGSAGWFYRLIAESFMGLSLEVDRLRFKPCLPADWSVARLTYRHCETLYRITLRSNAGRWDGAQSVTLDGVLQAEASVPLARDRREHQVEIVFS